jgi:hypothetical protein
MSKTTNLVLVAFENDDSFEDVQEVFEDLEQDAAHEEYESNMNPLGLTAADLDVEGWVQDSRGLFFRPEYGAHDFFNACRIEADLKLHANPNLELVC